MKVDDQMTVVLSLEIPLESEYCKIMAIWVNFPLWMVVALSPMVVSKVRYFLMHVQHQVGMVVDWDNLVQVVVVQVYLNKVLDPLVDNCHLVKSCLLLDFLLQLE